MAESEAPGAIRETEYEALLAALTETDRGRSFLDEYLRRQQKPETQLVLDAIARLEKTMTRERTVPSIDRIRFDIADMQEAIERTKREIANIKHESDDGNRFVEASNELDAIVTKTEAATQEILAAAEAIQEHAWTLREAGADEAACDDIDARATEIFMACSFQDLTGQRTQKIVNVLQYLESRINMMISIWGIENATGEDHPLVEDKRPDAHLLNGPQLEGRGVTQSAVDDMFDTDCDAAAPETASAADIDALFAADIDALFAADGDDMADDDMSDDDMSDDDGANDAEAVDFDAFDAVGDVVAEDVMAEDDGMAEMEADVEAEEVDIDALFAEGSMHSGADDAEIEADPQDDVMVADMQADAAADAALADADAADADEIDFDSIDFDSIDFDSIDTEPAADAAAKDDEMADAMLEEATPATDLAAHRARVREDEAETGDDPLEQLSPGERQALFS